MKKIFLSLSLSLWVICAYSQSENLNVGKFHLQKNGTFLTEDGKDFIVIDCPGKSQEDLYNEFLVAITKLYVSPETVVDSKVENQIIKVKGYDWPAFSIHTGKKVFGKDETICYGADHTLQFQFKEGRVRVDAPTLFLYRSIATIPPSKSSGYGMYVLAHELFSIEFANTNKNEEKNEKAKEKADRINKAHKEGIEIVNNYVNKLIYLIATNSLKPDNGSEW